MKSLLVIIVLVFVSGYSVAQDGNTFDNSMGKFSKDDLGQFVEKRHNTIDSISLDDYWRQLSDEGDYEHAAMILQYRAIKEGRKSRTWHADNWHAGQMLAMAGKYEDAKASMKYTYNVFYKLFGGEDAKTWYYYAKGTIAFLDDDKQGLERIIDKWEVKYPKDNNYKNLQRLLDNWGETYLVATSKPL